MWIQTKRTAFDLAGSGAHRYRNKRRELDVDPDEQCRDLILCLTLPPPTGNRIMRQRIDGLMKEPPSTDRWDVVNADRLPFV